MQKFKPGQVVRCWSPENPRLKRQMYVVTHPGCLPGPIRLAGIPGDHPESWFAAETSPPDVPWQADAHMKAKWRPISDKIDLNNGDVIRLRDAVVAYSPPSKGAQAWPTVHIGEYRYQIHRSSIEAVQIEGWYDFQPGDFVKVHCYRDIVFEIAAIRDGVATFWAPKDYSSAFMPSPQPVESLILYREAEK
jgi:hypothetical protein